ncbi:hypothetical protein FQN52_000808 [Onygenales sp. PD_12]|nr:hypothetical protein FQN53_003691 [Emmonsiellopsis sp. PD_33]KAK2782598.1 hypothetical protein FQN52_000808 [Onygenales sp. PD_12]
MSAEASFKFTPHPGTDTKTPHTTQSSPASPPLSTVTSTQAPSSSNSSSASIRQGALTASNLANHNRELNQSGSLPASTPLKTVQRAGESLGVAGIGLSSAQLRSQGYGLEGRTPMERYWLDDMTHIFKLSMKKK